jgi:CopG family nickel-responsive transcriptional regulator
MAVVSVSLPEGLVKEADRLIKAHGYAGRSDFVRAALRDFAASLEANEVREGRRTATLTTVYPAALERRVVEVAHDFPGVITSMMHSHVGTGRCLTVYIADGDVGEIKRLAARLQGLRDIDVVRVAYADGAGTARSL